MSQRKLHPRSAKLRRHRGFSLVELLVVIGIVIVLAAIAFSVFSSATHKAKDTSDIGNLRQIGQASEMYAADFDDKRPLSTIPLLSLNRIGQEVVVSRHDTSKEGFIRRFWNSIGYPDAPKSLPWRITYVGVGDAGWGNASVERKIEPHPAPGWMISFHEALASEKVSTEGVPPGPYFRLCLDGSVQRRVYSAPDPNSLVFADFFHD